MKYKITVVYSAHNIIKGARAYWLKNHMQDIIISPIVLAGLIVWIVYSNEKEMLHGVLLTLAMIYFITVYYLGLINPYLSAKKWNQSGLNSATWLFDESNIQVESELGISKFEWNNIKSFWDLQDVWIINYSNGGHSTLYLDNADEQIKLFIKNKLLKFKAKIS